ncbi:GNAT family N-acetyltransferase [Caldimonas tepidiphila]|uniref:GNAT family N-acetyltransferase n=1 Tax=Caldimonas tepidiphila TaxID=2315841 RepID=UPI000E5B4845|nr:GNAT family N-acetyltransferase [Caldimonas tepidiphila]
MRMPDILETPRCLLRKPQPGDAVAAFAGYAGDPRVTRYLGWRPHASVADTRRQISYDLFRWLKGSGWTWMVLRRDTEELAGLVELVPLSGQPHRARMGYLLGAAHWGRGLMSEAAGAVLREAMAQPDVFRVDAVCDVDNGASARVLEKIGMQYEGVLRRYIVHPNVSDEPRDVRLYAAARP